MKKNHTHVLHASLLSKPAPRIQRQMLLFDCFCNPDFKTKSIDVPSNFVSVKIGGWHPLLTRNYKTNLTVCFKWHGKLCMGEIQIEKVRTAMDKCVF